jgi:hypothetical protein
MDIQVLSAFFITNRIFLYSNDVHAVIAKPLLTAFSSVVLPRWVPSSDQYAGRSEKIHEAFVRVSPLTDHYSKIAPPSTPRIWRTHLRRISSVGRERGRAILDMGCSERINNVFLPCISRQPIQISCILKDLDLLCTLLCINLLEMFNSQSRYF